MKKKQLNKRARAMRQSVESYCGPVNCAVMAGGQANFAHHQTVRMQMGGR